MPACHDAFSAVLIERAGFQVAFMSGYCVSAAHLALPDVGLISYGEQLAVGRAVCEAAAGLCIIGDGDTGFGGVGNVRRTIEGYARAGFAGITIEDQVATPSSCRRLRHGARVAPEVVPRTCQTIVMVWGKPSTNSTAPQSTPGKSFRSCMRIALGVQFTADPILTACSRAEVLTNSVLSCLRLMTCLF